MSIKKNFFYNCFLTVANYIFPLLTFPYVSRILGADSIGKYNFIDNIIQIFIIVSMLGIGTVGVREIAQSKVSQEKLDKSFTALLTFNTLSTFLAIILLVALIFLIPKFTDYRDLLIIGGVKLLSTFLLIDWLYRGLEDFKFITQRTLIIKTLFVISVFLLIKDKEDYTLYYFLITFSITINAIINLLYARKHVRLNFDFREIKRITKPVFVLGAYSILAWLYNSFSTSFLGFISTDEQVGYYSTATKLYTIFLSIITAFTTVMLPRLSHLISQNHFNEFQQHINKSSNIILTISTSFSAFTIFFASDIIHIIAGKGYEGAIIPMMIIMPILLIVSIEQILIIQILTPLHKDKEVMFCTAWGAVFGIILNLILVPYMLCIGAAICWLSSELIVMSSAIYFIHKKTQISIPIYLLKKRIMPLCIVSISSYTTHVAFSDMYILIRLVLSTLIVTTITYLTEKFLVKNTLINEIESLTINFIKNKWKI